MTELIPTEQVLEQSIQIARQISNAIDVLRPLVYRVWKDDLWMHRFSSFAEYVESPDGLGKSQGYVSKLKQVEQFRIESGLSQEKIAGIDHESMYLALKSGGTPEEIVEKARTLTRAELKAERNEKEPCLHEEHGDVCYSCWTKL